MRAVNEFVDQGIAASAGSSLLFRRNVAGVFFDARIAFTLQFCLQEGEEEPLLSSFGKLFPSAGTTRIVKGACRYYSGIHKKCTTAKETYRRCSRVRSSNTFNRKQKDDSHHRKLKINKFKETHCNEVYSHAKHEVEHHCIASHHKEAVQGLLRWFLIALKSLRSTRRNIVMERLANKRQCLRAARHARAPVGGMRCEFYVAETPPDVGGH